MKKLATLVKLEKTSLERMLISIKRYQLKKSNLEKSKRVLIEKADLETNKYYYSPYAYMLEKYLANVRQQVLIIDTKIKEANNYITRIGEQVTVQFKKMVQFKVALEKNEENKAEQLKKLENKFLDEITSNNQLYRSKDY